MPNPALKPTQRPTKELKPRKGGSLSKAIDWTSDRRMFRDLAEATGSLAWITDPDGSCVYLSSGWLAFTGTAGHENTGYDWLNAVHPDDRVRARQTFFASNDSHLAYAVDYRLEHAPGGYALVWAMGLPKFSGDGQFQGYLGITTSLEQHQEQANVALQPGHHPPPPTILSAREREVVSLIAEGNTADTIAARLGISHRTVEAHATNAATKLGASNRVHTVAKAIKLNEI